MCIVDKDPTAFGLERAEYRALRSFLDDFHVFSRLFSRLLMLRISDNHDEKRNNGDCTAFHALYFVHTSSRLNQLKLYLSTKLDGTNLEKLFLTLTDKGEDLRFVFAATFWIAGGDTTARLRNQMTQPKIIFGELQIENWAIEDDIHNLVNYTNGHRFILACKQARLCDYLEPNMFCAVLEGSKEHGGDLSHNLPATDHIYAESVVGYMGFRAVDGYFLAFEGLSVPG